MKKSLIFASIACAGAFALHAEWTCQNWFKGIGASPSDSNLPTTLNPVNGSWAAQPASGSVPFAGSLSLVDGKLVFDLEDGEHLDFTVGATAAADSGTVTDVEVAGVFTPVSDNLPDDSTMNGRNAQVGFVVRIDGDATNYCAWTGSGWVALTNEAVDAGANIEAETKLLVRFDYRLSTKTASFAIVNGSATNFLGNATGVVALPITATAAAVAEGRVYGVSCYGSGTLAGADGGVGLGVADANGVKYGSLADAVAAAGTSETTINVLRETSESVTLPENSQITLNDNGKVDGEVTVPAGTEVKVAATSDEVNGGVSGPCSIPLDVKAAAADVAIVLPGTVGNYKEVANVVTTGSSLTFDLRTKTEIITNAVPTGGKKLAENPEGLHRFLADYGGSNYTKAEATTADIKTALETVSNAAGSNGLPNWECYVLGITPTTPIAPVAAATDESGDTIPLSIPAVMSATPSGDYTVKYQVGSGTAGAGIAVPAATGTYTVKIVLE